MTEPNTHSAFIQRLIEENDLPRQFTSFYQTPKGPIESAHPYQLLDSLGLERSSLSDIAANALDALEDLGKNSSDWESFRWKLTAFVHLQDIFDAAIQSGKELQTLFQQYYFYFESQIILAECVLAGLNGTYIASDVLLRPFLEFSVFQNYYYRVTRETRSYEALESYFSEPRQLSWGTAMRKALPKDNFCRPIEFRIRNHLRALSESTQHAYHPDSSVLQYRHRRHGHSVEGIFFWQKIRLILDAVLWLYYANFPNLFHPVDVLRKFGFNGPVGVLADPLTSHVVRKSLSEADYEAFKTYAARDAHGVDWALSQKDLTDAEIIATWSEDDPCPSDLEIAYGLHMARLRALRGGAAFRVARHLADLPDEVFNEMWTLETWSKLARRTTVVRS